MLVCAAWCKLCPFVRYSSAARHAVSHAASYVLHEHAIKIGFWHGADCCLHHSCRYTYSYTVQIVVINALDPDALPPVATLPLVNTTPGEKKGRPGIPSNKPKDSGDSPKNKPRAALESDGPDYVPDKNECQPPILDTIKLVSGATIKTPAASASGPKRVVDINHMSKRDHAKYLIKAASENVVTLGGGASDRRKAAAKLAAQAGPAASSRVLQSQGSLTGGKGATAPSTAAGLKGPEGQQQQQPVQQYMRQQSLSTEKQNQQNLLALLTEVGDGEQLKWIRDGVPKVHIVVCLCAGDLTASAVCQRLYGASV